MEIAEIELQNSGEALLGILSLASMFAGLVLGLIACRGATFSLARVPYFIIWAAVYGLTVALFPFAWILTLNAMNTGMFWLPIALFCGGWLCHGVALAILAHARTVNAFGNGRFAWFVLVPLLNLILLILFFKRPMHWSPTDHRRWTLNVLGIAFGVLLLLLGSSVTKLTIEMFPAFARRLTSDSVNQSLSVEALLRQQGVEATLKKIASETRQQSVDNTTTLLRAEATGLTLRYVYEVANEAVELPKGFRDLVIRSNCNDKINRALIDSGGTIQHQYLRRDHSYIGLIIVTPQMCGN